MPLLTTSWSRLFFLLLGMVIIAGCGARLYAVDRMVVWHDEVFSLARVFGYDGPRLAAEIFSDRDLVPDDLLAFQRPSLRQDWGATLASLMEHPEHSPLFYLAARLVAPAFDSSLTGVRTTSALLSLLLVPAMFWLARELFDDARAAWTVAALVACSPMHLLYAQEARQYALWTVLAAASSAALLGAMRTQRGRDWALYGLLAALGLYAHLMFLPVLMTHGLYLVLRTRGGAVRQPGMLRSWSVALALALLLFAPWLVVVVTRWGQLEQVTAWMQRPAGAGPILEAWGMNLVRVFADVPAAGSLLMLGLLPLAGAVWWYCRRAPASARLFACLLFLPFAAAILVPDLVQGGSRSLHPRYLLPGFLALELAAGYVAARGTNEGSYATRLAARSVFFVTIGGGVISCWLILHADTWWTKNFSSRNREVATIVNAASRPLVMVSGSSVAIGEVISLAYALRQGVIIRGERPGRDGVPEAGFSDLFLLTPSAELRAALADRYVIEPMLDTWQWYRAVPKGAGRHGTPAAT